jgi:hypothetical protein
MWINTDVKQFWIHKSENIDYFEEGYCNATLQNLANANGNPYPIRFKCTALSDKI